jgi:Tfp pilus assembly protein PilO
MKNSPDRKVIFALLAIAGLCVIGLGASLYRSKVAQLGQMQRELAEKRARLASLHDKLEQQPQLEAEYARLRARLSVLEPALPTSEYIPTFLRQIEELATGTNNRIIMIRPKQQSEDTKKRNVAINDETGEVASGSGADSAAGGKTESKPKLPYDQVPIEVKVQGSYWTVIDFLSELQRFRKMIAANDIDFSPQKLGVQTSSALSVTLALTAVVTKEGAGGARDAATSSAAGA